MLSRFTKQIDYFIGSSKIYHMFDIFRCKVIWGFAAQDYFFYELYKKSRYSRKQYMTNRQSKAFERKENSSQDSNVLVDKYQFDKKFSKYVNRDFLYMKDSSFDSFSSFVKKNPSFMAKKNWLCEGVGITREYLSGENDIKLFYQTHKDEFLLLEEPIVQHKRLSALHPQSVNTLRVTTLFYGGKAHIVAAALRVGTGDNCTDNLHNAGLACAVDAETGIVISCGFDKHSNTFLRHPDTNEVLLGFSVPNWDSVLKTVLEAAMLVPTIKWIGWDEAITEKSCVLVEGNTIQGVDLIQVGQDGLWPKIRKIQAS